MDVQGYVIEGYMGLDIGPERFAQIAHPQDHRPLADATKTIGDGGRLLGVIGKLEFNQRHGERLRFFLRRAAL